MLGQRRAIVVQRIQIKFHRAQLVRPRLQIGSRRIRCRGIDHPQQRRFDLNLFGVRSLPPRHTRQGADANGEKRDGNQQNLGQDDIGHPQLVDTFWHSFGQPAKIFCEPLNPGSQAGCPESPKPETFNAAQSAHCLLV